MEFNRKKSSKINKINPSCIKDINMNCVNIFDTYIGNSREEDYNFEKSIKLKRNFK